MRVHLLLLVLVSLALTGCETADDPHKGYASVDKVVSYENGVYYLPMVEANFGKSLSAFLANNDSLEVATIAGNGTGVNGFERGYFVVFHKKRAALLTPEAP